MAMYKNCSVFLFLMIEQGGCVIIYDGANIRNSLIQPSLGAGKRTELDGDLKILRTILESLDVHVDTYNAKKLAYEDGAFQPSVFGSYLRCRDSRLTPILFLPNAASIRLLRPAYDVLSERDEKYGLFMHASLDPSYFVGATIEFFESYDDFNHIGHLVSALSNKER